MITVAKDAKFRIGTVIADKYRVTRELGRGAMGTVYEAVHTGIGKHVALKFLDADIEENAPARARFLREAQTASLVDSPHVVQIFDSGYGTDGVPFLVLELLHGEDLRSRLRREGRLSVEDALTIVEQTLRALVRMHAAGIVHRDLKPENIFLCAHEGSGVFVKLLDFGISKVTQTEATLDTLTHEGVVLGTAFYMSPEQARGESDLDGRSDLYSVGAIFYEMLSGRTPHVGNVYHAVLVDICTHDAADVRLLAPQVPDAIAQSIARSLNRDRDARFANAQSFIDDLAPFVQGRLSTGDNLRTSTSTLVSQPPHPALETSPTIRDVSQRKSSLGKIIVGSLILALLIAAALMRVVQKRAFASLAPANSARPTNLPVFHGGEQTPNLPSNVAAAAPIATRGGASSPATSSVTPSTFPMGNRHRAGQAGTSISRPPPRASAGIADELQLKTKMP